MKDIKKKITYCFLSSVMAMSCIFCAACSRNEGTSQSSVGEEEQSYALIENGRSDYVIVVPKGTVGSEQAAAQVLSDYLYAATSCRLPIITDEELSRYQDFNYIHIGETAGYIASGLKVDKNALNGDGYVLKSVEEDIFVVAGKKTASYQYAAYELLNELIDFEAYSYDEIYYNTAETVRYSEMDITDIPSFKYRYCFNQDVYGAEDSASYMNLLRNNDIVWGKHGGGHTVFKFLPTDVYYDEHPEWYTGKGGGDQLCWSQQDMVEELAKQVVLSIPESSANMSHIMIGQNDGRRWCQCDDCAASLETYGANSAVLIKGINYIAKEVQKYLDENEPGREIYVGTFAYTSTEKPPIKKDENGKVVAADESLIMEPNTFVQIAPIDTDYSQSYYDAANETYANNFNGWSLLCPQIIVWSYNTNFSFYFVPFLPYNAIKENYQFMYENNVTRMMEQGADSYQIGFLALRNYVSSKLMWDHTQDLESLIDNFFDNYYRDASVSLKKFFDEYQAWFNVLMNEYSVISGSIYCRIGSVLNAFPETLLVRWEKYFDEAEESIKYIQYLDETLYTKIYQRIDKERLFIDYVRIFLNSDYADKELNAMRLNFKTRCELYGITKYNETSPLSDVYATWGLS